MKASLIAESVNSPVAQSVVSPSIKQEPLTSTENSGAAEVTESVPDLKEKHFTIFYGDTGHNYESIIGPYLYGAKSIQVEDPFVRMPHQIQNFVRLCETIVKLSTIKRIELITGYDDDAQKHELEQKLGELKQSLLETDIALDFDFNPNIHDREIRIDNGWVIKIGRGLDFFQKPSSWFEIGTNDLALRKCLETKVDIFCNTP
jgi:ATP-dependent Lon protease